MKVYIINGSPRKNWNTGTMLEHIAKGVESMGVEAVRHDLYSLDYKGCVSCFACKMVNGKSYGRCARRDGITPILDGIREDACAVVLGSPIYWLGMTGEARSFLERLLFAPVIYDYAAPSLFPRKIRSAGIYTMNVPEERAVQEGYTSLFDGVAARMQLVYGMKSEVLCAYDTLQFPDYSKVVMKVFDPVHKAQRHKEVFPEDCRRAFELGQRLAAPLDS